MKTARNIIAGGISGLGIVILLQQYAVAYPTGMITIIGVLFGIAVQFAIAQIAAHQGVGVAAAGVGSDNFAPAVMPLGAAASATWVPTHRVPAQGLDAFETRDGTAAAVARLDGGLDVIVEETSGDWARVTCENGWKAWVDARRLEVRS